MTDAAQISESSPMPTAPRVDMKSPFTVRESAVLLLLLVIFSAAVWITRPALWEGQGSAVGLGDRIKCSFDLNTASQKELGLVPSVGRWRAGEIIKRRAEKPFSSVNELATITRKNGQPVFDAEDLKEASQYLTVNREQSLQTLEDAP